MNDKSTSSSSWHRLTSLVIAILCGWLVAAFALSAAGLVAELRPPGPQVVLFALVAVLLAGVGLFSSFCGWVCFVPLRYLLTFHVVRFVGFDFLWLYRQGRLPFP